MIKKIYRKDHDLDNLSKLSKLAKGRPFTKILSKKYVGTMNYFLNKQVYVFFTPDLTHYSIHNNIRILRLSEN